MPHWTESQAHAITDRHQTLLVAASAGAGKTAVLTERLVRLVLDPEEPAGWDDLLVVTFSEAAAAQMRERVEQRLRQLLATDLSGEDRNRLARQLALLPQAHISTLHSFCLQLIRRHFVELQLDPDVGVLSPEETMLLRQEVLDQLLDHVYQSVAAGRDEGMAQWLHEYGGRRGISQVTRLVRRLYQYGESLPHPRIWWQKLGASYDWVDDPRASDSWQSWPAGWRRALLEGLSHRLQEALAALGRAERWAQRPDGPRWHLPTFAQAVRQVEQVVDAAQGAGSEWNELHELLEVHWPRLSSRGGPARNRGRLATAGAGPAGAEADAATNSAVVARAKAEWERARRVWNELQDWFAFDASELRAKFARQRPAVAALARLVLMYDQQLQERKRQLNRIDFADMEHLTLAWLESRTAPGVGGPMFKEVLVDEYQDINPVQEAILTGLAEGGRRFMVGDAKQSIYRFRHTDPAIFLDRFRRYLPVGVSVGTQADAAAAGARRLVLQENFRSRATILAAVNWSFRQLMRGGWAELDYGPDQELQPGLDYPPLPDDTAAGMPPAPAPAPTPSWAKGPSQASRAREADRWRCAGDPPVEVHLMEARADVRLSSAPMETATDGGVDPDEGQSEATMDDPPEPEDSGDEATATQAQREALWVAARVRRLLYPRPEDRPADYMVWDSLRQAFRPCQAQDVVILLRTWSGLRFYLEGLQQLGIVAVAKHGSGLFRAVEIQQMLTLLEVLDNPRRDIALAAFLRSPLAMPDTLTVEELSQLRAGGGGGCLWDDCRVGAAKEVRPAAEPDASGKEPVGSYPGAELLAKLDRLVARLDDWRTQARRQPLAQLVWQIWQETGFCEYYGALPGGHQRQANLRFFYDQMRQFDGFARQGLARAVRFLRSLQEIGAESPAAGTPVVQAQDAVQILSIHESKGLEFPVVILAGLGQRFNDEDVRQQILFHRDLGIALAGVDAEQGVVVNLPSQVAVAGQVRADSRAEELRILYVAMTRARERLILCGSLADLPEQVGRWCELAAARDSVGGKGSGVQRPGGPSPLPADRLQAARCPLDWLGPSWVLHPDATALRELAGPLATLVAGDTVTPTPPFRFRFGLHRVEELTAMAAELAAGPTGVNAAAGDSSSESPSISIAHGQATISHPDPVWLQPSWWQWRYPHQEMVQRPAKISVTDWQHQVWLADEEQEAVPLPPGQRRLPDQWRGLPQLAGEEWPRPSFLLQRERASRALLAAGPAATEGDGESRAQRGVASAQRWRVNAATRGTATHRLLEHLDVWTDPLDHDALARQRDQLVEREICTAAEAESIPLDQVEAFLHTELGQWLVQTARKSPHRVYRELRFHLAVGEPSDRMMVQGAVDCLVETETGEFVLIDYKTDQLPAAAASRGRFAGAPADLDPLGPWVDRYRFQLQVYRQAIEQICRRPVRHAYLVWLSIGGKATEVL